jgi:hypothetical protein
MLSILGSDEVGKVTPIIPAPRVVWYWTPNWKLVTAVPPKVTVS